MEANRAGGISPATDPTVLTTEALHREILGLTTLMTLEIDRARDVTEEKFHSVNKQLTLVETQRVEQKKDTKDAVDAALTAQKEAVREQTTASERAIAKSEASTKEALNNLTTTFNTAIAGLITNLDDLKERVGKIESIKQGGVESKRESQLTTTLVLSVLAVVLTVIIVGLAIYATSAGNR